eukprot:SAG31_NODE_2667_length_5273_cov_2.316776_9_plen_461_part_00
MSKQIQNFAAESPTDSTSRLKSRSCAGALAETIKKEAAEISSSVQECLEKQLCAEDSAATTNDDDDDCAMRQLNRLAERAAVLLADASALQDMDGSSTPGMKNATAELSSLAEYVRTMQVEANGRVFARRERRFAAEVAAHFAVIQMPKDGDCMFWSVHIGLISQRCSSTDRSLAAAAEALRTPDSTGTAMFELRQKVMAHMKQHAVRYRKPALVCCSEALAAVGGGGTTVSALRDAMISHFSVCKRHVGTGSDGGDSSVVVVARRALALYVEDFDSLSKDSQRDADEAFGMYLHVMSMPGIFGERLQLQAASELLQIPLKLHYYAGGDTTPNAKADGVSVPCEVFSPHDSPSSAFSPYKTPAAAIDDQLSISILHHVGGNHYDLVLSKPHDKTGLVAPNPFISPMKAQPSFDSPQTASRMVRNQENSDIDTQRGQTNQKSMPTKLVKRTKRGGCCGGKR